MMNVTEKFEYLKKRQKFHNHKKSESGITDDVLEVLRKRKMSQHDLEFLPACEIKDILEISKKAGGSG